MAALHRKRFLRNQLAGIGVENACGAGIERGIDGEDQHGGMVSLITPSWPACPGHPRLCCGPRTWMPGTRPGMTRIGAVCRCEITPAGLRPPQARNVAAGS